MNSSAVRPDSSKRIAIIGAGITGLAAAHRLLELSQSQGRSAEITLFEASSRHGGLFGTQRIGNYLIERGADSFITNNPAAVGLCERLGIELIPTEARFRRSLILLRGKPIPTPEGFNLLAPARLGPLLATPLLSWSGKLRVLMEYFIPRSTASEDESLASFVRRRFGTEILDRIVQPLVGGIYTSDVERLSLAAALPRFVQMEQRHGSLIRAMQSESRAQPAPETVSGARYGLFATPREGMQVLLDTLLDRIAGRVTLRLGTRIQSLSQVNDSGTGPWQLALDSADRLQFDAVIVATSALQAARLLAKAAPSLSSALGEIEYASSAIVVSGHRQTDITYPCNAFGLVIPHCERRKILAVSFLNRKFPDRAPPDRLILRTFVGGAMQPDEIDCTDDQLAHKVLGELKQILGVRGTPEFLEIVRYPNSMPQFTLGHLTRCHRIRELGAAHPNLHLAGNYFEGVGVPDAVASGELAAEAVLSGVSACT